MILLIYLFIMSRTILMFRTHRGLGTLFGATIYIFLVYSGWYGILASYLVWWMILTIVISMGVFFFGRVIHPSETETRFKIGQAIRKKVVTDRQKEKDIARLRNYLRDLERDKEKVERQLRSTPPDSRLAEALKNELAELDKGIRQTRDQIRALEG